LPNISIAKPEEVPDEIAYEGEYEFTDNWFTGNVPIWNVALASFKGKPNINYLEIGVYEGRSALWMLETVLTHSTAKMTGVDIFAGPYKDLYRANIKASGSADKVNTITGPSQLVLRTLPLGSFDIIYIDGSHLKNDVLEDAVLSWRLLKEGGILIFDDYRWLGVREAEKEDPLYSGYPKIAIEAFVQCFDEHLETIHNDYQLIVRKTSSSVRGS
jgi:predicted O-methyltransferase YrrM